MNGKIHRLRLAWKAFNQLGWKVSLLYAWYLFTLRSGILKRLTPVHSEKPKSHPIEIQSLSFPTPTKSELYKILGREVDKLINEADEIVGGQARLFGGPPQAIIFKLDDQEEHWTSYRSSWVAGQDIKIPWEIGRFGWATVLARAYRLSENEAYAEAFWQYAETFLHANPPNVGIQWISAQEVDIRLIALVFCYQVFADSPHTTPERVHVLKVALIAHAQRIPPTLAYARAQENNHLLTEAVGLYTAAAALPDHPQAKRWRKLGWKWFNQGIQNQIKPDGSYIQNSANYHRLMLQAALWMAVVAEHQGDVLPEKTTHSLAAATQWLLSLLDKGSGKTPNWGGNDGAYILPLTVCDFTDYRPVLQAAGQVFLGSKPLSDDIWDEMATWLHPQNVTIIENIPKSNVLRLDGHESWAVLRVAPNTNRHGHADQLHLDLWWRGLNIAQDPGTYLYNAPPPWENPLKGTDAHNTISINSADQMTRAGRFLWLDWNEAKVNPPSTPTRVSAEHNGYRQFEVTHQRTVEVSATDTWEITDKVIASQGELTDIRLHWLLPDWAWELSNTTLRLKSPHGWVVLDVQSTCPIQASITRAGEIISGEGPAQPHHGWVSFTYNHKSPALSLAITTRVTPPVTLVSKFSFPG